MRKGLRVGLVVSALALFFAVASFNHERPGPNVWSRIGPAINLIEHGTLELGEFGRLTHDKRIVDGREFSDKAPGSIFIAALAYGLFFKLTGFAENLTADQVRYLLSALILGISAVLFFEFLSRLLQDKTRNFPSYLASVAYILSAPVFANHIVYFGHQLASLFVLVALVFAIHNQDSVAPSFFAGLFFGLATVVEYPVFVLGLWASILFLKSGRKNFLIYALALLLFSAVPIGLYNWLCFGNPFSFSYSQVALPYYRERMARGFFGFTHPSLENLWLLSISPSRGLFFWGPAFFAGFLGLIFGIFKNEQKKALYLWALLGFLIYLILFSSYHEPSGGAAFGPRHLLPALLFLALGWLEFWSLCRSFAIILLILWISSAAAGLVFAGAEPLLPAGIKNPLVEFYPLIFKNGWMIDNWGHYLGLDGWRGLLVPLAFFILAFLGAWKANASALECEAFTMNSPSFLVYAILILFALLLVLQGAFARTEEGVLHTELANYHFVWNRWKNAESEYVLAAQSRRDPYIYYYLSLTRIELKDYRGALCAIEDSYRLDPDENLVLKLKGLEDWLMTRLKGKL